MSIKEKVSITISIAKNYRDRLRTMAAQQNLHDPDQLTSASTLAREIICEHIDELERIEADFVGDDAETGQEPGSGQLNETMTEKLEG
jgi:hypothetical protein